MPDDSAAPPAGTTGVPPGKPERLSGTPEPPGLGVRLAFAGALGLLAVLLVTSARTPPPPEVRVGQRIQLVELITAQQARHDELVARVEQLSAEVAALEREIAADTEEILGLQEQVDRLAVPAGWTVLRGPGVVATLSDSLGAVPPDGDVNDYVIHEEDLQAVINALWAGGAEAMTVNGHRILTTTAIRCVGNVLLLHGRTHSPPYVIEAIGDQAELHASLARDPAVTRFERAVHQFKLGYQVASSDDLLVAAYEGSTGIQVARPAGALTP